MKRMGIGVGMCVILCAAGLCQAKEDTFCVLEKERTATSPIGAVVECVGVFTGKLASAVEISATGERKITVENETGECRIFPFCATTKIVDSTFNAVTLDQLKTGEKVKVEYEKRGTTDMASSVTVEK